MRSNGCRHQRCPHSIGLSGYRGLRGVRENKDVSILCVENFYFFIELFVR